MAHHFCSICHSKDHSPLQGTLPCGHAFHPTCLCKCIIAHVFNQWDQGIGNFVNSDPVSLFTCPLCRAVPAYKNLDDAVLPYDNLRGLCEVKAYFNFRLKGYVARRVPTQWQSGLFRSLEATTRDVRSMFMFQSMCQQGVITLGAVAYK